MQDPANFEQWRRLLAWFARRAHRRSVAAGGRVAFEDVFSECCVAWCVARDKFDPAQGVKFSAYLINGAARHVNRWLQRQIDATGGRNLSLEGDNKNSLSEVLADVNAGDPELEAARRATLDAFIHRLPPRAGQYLRLLAEPPEEILVISRALEARVDYARARGFSRFAFKHAYSRVVFDLMGCGQAERQRILHQIKTLIAKRERSLAHGR